MKTLKISNVVYVAMLLYSMTTNGQTLYVPGGTVGTSSNGNVGIGTNVPNSLMDIRKSITPDVINKLAYFGYSGSMNRSIALQQIGTATTGANQYIFFNGELGSTSTFATPTLSTSYEYPIGLEYKNNLFSIVYSPTAGVTDGAIQHGFSFQPSSGNIGIGTVSPGYKLHLKGTNRAHIGLQTTDPNDAYAYLRFLQAGNDFEMGHNGVSGKFYINPSIGIGEGSAAIVIPENGNVGIGTTGPNAKLDVRGTGIIGDGITIPASGGDLSITDSGSDPTLSLHGNSGNKYFSIDANGSNNLVTFTNFLPGGGSLSMYNGNVGIGTTSPGTKLHIESTAAATVVAKIKSTQAQEASLQLQNSQGHWEIKADEDGDFFRIADVGTASRLTIDSFGNVGIGTINPSEKLTVNGKILAEEVRVVVDVPDYVFEKEYKLKTLSEVSKYIIEHKHLPEVPSEKEVMNNGGQVSLGEMNMTLLKKIEELTLYAIEQDETIKSLFKRVADQDETMKSFFNRVTEIEKQ